jgi:hypothetical protein
VKIQEDRQTQIAFLFSYIPWFAFIFFCTFAVFQIPSMYYFKKLPGMYDLTIIVPFAKIECVLDVFLKPKPCKLGQSLYKK